MADGKLEPRTGKPKLRSGANWHPILCTLWTRRRPDIPILSKLKQSAVEAITWKQVDGICAKLNSLNPYDPNIVSDILKVEEQNYDRQRKLPSLRAGSVRKALCGLHAKERQIRNHQTKRTRVGNRVRSR